MKIPDIELSDGGGVTLQLSASEDKIYVEVWFACGKCVKSVQTIDLAKVDK